MEHFHCGEWIIMGQDYGEFLFGLSPVISDKEETEREKRERDGERERERGSSSELG